MSKPPVNLNKQSRRRQLDEELRRIVAEERAEQKRFQELSRDPDESSKGKEEEEESVAETRLQSQLRIEKLGRKKAELLRQFEALDPVEQEEIVDLTKQPGHTLTPAPPKPAPPKRGREDQPEAPPAPAAKKGRWEWVQENPGGSAAKAQPVPAKAAPKASYTKNQPYPVRGSGAISRANAAPMSGPAYNTVQDQELIVNPYVPLEQPPLKLLTTLSIYGKRRSGKSVWVKWFCNQPGVKDEFPYVYVFTKTKLNDFYQSFVPEKYIFPGLDDGKLLAILRRQERALDLYHSNPDRPVNPKVLIIIDDENENIRFNKVLEQFYVHGRHRACMIIFCAQHWSLTPPVIRSQTDQAVLFNSDYKNAIEEFWQDFAGKADKHAFIRMMETHLTDHGFVVIDNDPNVGYDKKFYYGKAEDLEADIKHILGCRQAWQGSEKQLQNLLTGKHQKKMENTKKLSERGTFSGRTLDDCAPPDKF